MKDRINSDENLLEEFPPVTPEDWKAEIIKDLKGVDIGKLDWKTYEGFTVHPFYTEEDLSTLGYLTDALPDEFPYTRGYKTRSNEWRVNEYITSGSIKEANRLSLKGLENGADSLTFLSESSHDSISGIPIQSALDMSALLKDIPIEKIPIHFRCGYGAAGILSLFIIEAEKRGIEKAMLTGSVDADPIRILASNGAFPSGEKEAFEKLGAMIHYLSGSMPSYGALVVSGHHFHDSGASVTQGLAFTIAAGVEYLDRLTSMDIGVDRISRHMSFSFSISSNYFMEIAKLRAARLLWAHIVEQYGSKDESSKEMKIVTRTSSWNKTVFDPYVNMLRSTVEAMASAIGGSDIITVLPLDSTYKEPDEFSRRMARNTQLILKNESYLDRVIDPAGGSYYVEKLTDSIAASSWELFRTVESKGGIVEALKSGFVQDEIRKTRNERDADIASRKVISLGVNQYPNPDEEGPRKIDSGIPGKPLKRSVNDFKARSTQYMERLTKYLSGKGSMLGDVLPGAEANPELKIERLEPYRGAEAFEKLRLDAIRYKRETGLTPKVFLLPVGNPSMRNARASFSGNFFTCAGFKIIENQGFDTADGGVRAALKSGAKIVVICSSDADYTEYAPEICRKLKEKNPDIRIITAGNPKENAVALKASGVDDFIHARSNALQILRKYQEIYGIRHTTRKVQ
ncbi:MAG: methylmalonyl-CoA mutase family protein [Thermodesulfobacteriota bacterium]